MKAFSIQQCLFLGIIHTTTWGHRPGAQHQSLGKRGHQQSQLEESLEGFPAVAVLSPLAADCRRWLQPKERNWGKKVKKVIASGMSSQCSPFSICVTFLSPLLPTARCWSQLRERKW